MALYAGIDLHSNNSVIVVQDEEDNVVGRRRADDERAGQPDHRVPHLQRRWATHLESMMNVQPGGPCPSDVGESMMNVRSGQIIVSPTSRGGGPPILSR